MTHTYVIMAHSHETWLIHLSHGAFIWDMTHPYESWPIDMRHAHTYTHAFHDSFTGGAALIDMSVPLHERATIWACDYMSVRLIHRRSLSSYMTHSHVPWRIHMSHDFFTRAMTHAQKHRDSLVHVMTAYSTLYGVMTCMMHAFHASYSTPSFIHHTWRLCAMTYWHAPRVVIHSHVPRLIHTEVERLMHRCFDVLIWDLYSVTQDLDVCQWHRTLTYWYAM